MPDFGAKTVFLCLLVLVTVPIAVSAADFNISTDQEIDITDRTIEQGGNTFEITSMTQVDPDDQITVSVDAPADTEFTMYLYDENRTIVRGYEGTGSTEFDVPVADHSASEAGTYAFIVQSDAVNEVAHPMVVKGYSVSSDSPESVTVGESVSIEGEFTQLRGESFEQIDVVVAATDTDEQVVKQASINGSSFSASVSTDDLESGSYDAYAVVRGSDTVLGQKEVLGLSSPQSLEIKADESGNTDDSTGSSGGGGGAAPADTPTEDDTSETSEQASLSDGPVTRSVADANPDQGGVNVPVNAGPIGQISFDIAEQDATGELTVSQSSATTNVFESEFGADRVKTAVSITVPESLTSTTATVEFGLSEEELNGTAPSDLQVVKNTEGGSQVLSSTTEETSDGGVVVTARTPGFSDFAVIAAPADSETTTAGDDTTAEDDSTDNNTGGGETTDTTSSNDTDSQSTDEQTPGFGPVVALIALLAAAFVGTRSD